MQLRQTSLHVSSKLKWRGRTDRTHKTELDNEFKAFDQSLRILRFSGAILATALRKETCAWTFWSFKAKLRHRSYHKRCVLSQGRCPDIPREEDPTVALLCYVNRDIGGSRHLARGRRQLNVSQVHFFVVWGPKSIVKLDGSAMAGYAPSGSPLPEFRPKQSDHIIFCSY